MLPKDPMILLSYTNTKLRDDYATLDEMCDDLGIDRTEIEQPLAELGYSYSKELNKFV
ncbi:MAG: DUF4250 domain-containing protein [Ruminococcus sp.]|nr:DUF4250 domain-containing protein [Ruminococcus sp.]MEE0855976.1 DUF4250 domain-containing protein [Ruminococcus sp.]MEE1173700.1 DUF4250 domain-containing protein [Ruminococcus sp.]